VKDIVTTRFDQIGPKTRVIFATKENYDLYLGRTLSSVSGWFSKMGSFSVYNVPKEANMFIGAFVNADVDIPYSDLGDNYQLKFLSSNLAVEIANKAEAEDIAQLHRSRVGLEYQIAEELVCYGLKEHGPHCDDPILVKNWKWYKNPTNPNATELSAVQLLESHLRPVIFPRRTVISFNKQTMKQLVTDLSDTVIYRCILVNGWLYDMMIVDHDKKIVYVFQVTKLKAGDHNCDYSTIKKVMDDMKIIENNYEMYYIHCSDASQKSESAVVKVTNNKKLTKSETDKIDKHMKIFIARVPYYPNKPVYEI
jgi:hypothetical protein